MGEWFKKLSPTMQIVIVIIAGILLWLIIRSIRTYAGRAGQIADSLGEQAALSSQGIHRTYTQSQYSGFANQLYYAMDGVGTDEDSIIAVFHKMENDQDILALINAYGVRDGYDLQAWLRGDLSASYMNQINSMLTTKGISKTF